MPINKNFKPATTWLVATFLFLLTIISTTASSYDDFNDIQKGSLGYGFCEWKEGAFFSQRTSNQDGCEGNIPYQSNNTIISTLAVGANFQPFISNTVIGGDNLLFTISGTDLDILSMNSLGGLELFGQVNLGFTPNTQPIMVDLNNDNYTDMLVGSSTNLYVLYNNISDPNLFTIHNVHTGAITTGIACMNMSIDIYCFMGGGFSGVINNISIYNASSNTVTNINVYGANSASFARSYSNVNSPIIKDWDNDGFLELFFITDANGNGYDGFNVFQLSSSGIPSSELIFNDVQAGGTISGMAVYNIDGVGDTEIVISNHAQSASDFIKVYNSGGSLFGSASFTTNADTFGHGNSNPIIAQVNTSSILKEVCFAHYNGQTGTNGLNCYSGKSGSLVLDTSINSGLTDLTTSFISSNDINGDGYDEIFIGTGIWYPNATTFKKYTLSGTSASGNWVSGDVNNEGLAEACQSLATSTTCISSTGTGVGGGTNVLPQVKGNFGLGFANPICLGTELAFFSAEDTTQNIANYTGTMSEGTNYINDAVENERIYIQCGNGQSFITIYSATSPIAYCNYTTHGTFYATICVLDAANPTLTCPTGALNRRQQTIYVIDGTPGVTCNLGVLGTGDDAVTDITVVDPTNTTQVTDYAQASINNNIVSFIDWITQYWKLMLGFLLWAGVTVGTAILTHGTGYSGVATLFVAILSFIILCLATLFPIWILVLAGFSLILIVVLIIFLKGK